MPIDRPHLIGDSASDSLAPRLRRDCLHFEQRPITNETLLELDIQKSRQLIDNRTLYPISTIAAKIPEGRRFPATVPVRQQHFGGKRL
ncbi:hypothetical protein IVA80_28105 [Bradyrhizobium sp. 139]|nr:hypothetical protein [Bradyrhizobium sp. 139]